MVTGPRNTISPRNVDRNESSEIKTRHALNNAFNFCSATFSDQPTEAAPVWERLISSRCATGKSARISTATRERTNAMPGTLTMSCIATSTTGCLMNTQTVSVHPQVEDGVQQFSELRKSTEQKTEQPHWNCQMRSGVHTSLTSGFRAEYSFWAMTAPSFKKTDHLF